MALVVGTGFATLNRTTTTTKPVQIISGSLLKITADDMLRDASVIAKGSLIGESSPFKIRQVNGDKSVFTDYYFELQNVIRGEVAPGERVSVRVRGGEAADYIVVDETSPNFAMDQEYLLFLQAPGMGGGYNTVGDYYYIMGVSQGIFTEESDGVYTSEHGEEINLAATPMAILESEPIPDAILNYYLDALQKNVDSGFISEEEYNLYVAQADEYAAVIK